jgi:hypothetical protein
MKRVNLIGRNPSEHEFFQFKLGKYVIETPFEVLLWCFVGMLFVMCDRPVVAST